MKFYLGVTDNNWYRYLSDIAPEDVNFWQPGGRAGFNVLKIGAPFLFKLKYTCRRRTDSPRNCR
jgi:putative restriction endonuclease